jgi:hypothetical protein
MTNLCRAKGKKLLSEYKTVSVGGVQCQNIQASRQMLANQSEE